MTTLPSAARGVSIASSPFVSSHTRGGGGGSESKLSKLRSRLTYANVMATIAVFIALGGVSYAAVKFPANSVGTTQLKKNAVTGAKIKTGSVAGSDLAMSVRSQLARTGAAGGVQGQTGARGPSFGDSRQLPNMNAIPCEEEVVVGSQTLTVTEPSRIWIHGHGTVRDNFSDPSDYGLWLRLRNAATRRRWRCRHARGTPRRRSPLTSPSRCRWAVSCWQPTTPTHPLPRSWRPRGATSCSLPSTLKAACAGGPNPDFGLNQGSAMGYLLVGAG